MIETKDITSMVTHVVRRSQGVPDSNIMHPMREWVVGLSAVATLVVIGVMFDVVTYRAYDASLATAVPVAPTAVPYKAALVESALNLYQAERQTYESIRGVSTNPPSIPLPATTTNPTIKPTTLPPKPVTTTISTTAATTTETEATTSESIVSPEPQVPPGEGKPIPVM